MDIEVEEDVECAYIFQFQISVWISWWIIWKDLLRSMNNDEIQWNDFLILNKSHKLNISNTTHSFFAFLI